MFLAPKAGVIMRSWLCDTGLQRNTFTLLYCLVLRNRNWKTELLNLFLKLSVTVCLPLYESNFNDLPMASL